MGHVRAFSPWTYNIDDAARSLLERSGWTAPDGNGLPTGGEIMRDYLAPLAALPEISSNLKLGAAVTAVMRQGHDKVSNEGKESSLFVVRYVDKDGEHCILAVVDASGTWTRPNPIGIDGLPVPGEREAAARIAYGIPDVIGSRRDDYAGKRTSVIGGGHSAINVAIERQRF